MGRAVLPSDQPYEADPRRPYSLPGVLSTLDVIATDLRAVVIMLSDFVRTSRFGGRTSTRTVGPFAVGDVASFRITNRPMVIHNPSEYPCLLTIEITGTGNVGDAILLSSAQSMGGGLEIAVDESRTLTTDREPIQIIVDRGQTYWCAVKTHAREQLSTDIGKPEPTITGDGTVAGIVVVNVITSRL